MEVARQGQLVCVALQLAAAEVGWRMEGWGVELVEDLLEVEGYQGVEGIRQAIADFQNFPGYLGGLCTSVLHCSLQ
eukprot:scaffold76717_cov19-Tisochrysis_lutea.AAC.1